MQSPMQPSAIGAEILSSQGAVAVLAVWIIQKAKAAAWFPAVQKDAVAMNRFFSILIAALSALGIHMSFSGFAADQGVLVISGLTAGNLIHIAWYVIQQAIGQEVLFKALRGYQAMMDVWKQLQIPMPEPLERARVEVKL